MNTEDDEFARIAREQALNKMADNARELGLEYEPAQQEPVATVIKSGVNRTWISEALGQLPDGTYSLYTSPPAQRKPLTDDEIYGMYNEPRSDAEMVEFARAIEAAHGIKENT